MYWCLKKWKEKKERKKYWQILRGSTAVQHTKTKTLCSEDYGRKSPGPKYFFFFSGLVRTCTHIFFFFWPGRIGYRPTYFFLFLARLGLGLHFLFFTSGRGGIRTYIFILFLIFSGLGLKFPTRADHY